MPSRRRAFTLIELLIVVGMIAVLLSLILGTLSGVRKFAQRASCENNVRTLLNGVLQYVSDDDQHHLPYPNWGPGGTYDPGPSQPGWCYNYPNFGKNPSDVRGGALWKYVQSETVYHCPLHQPPYSLGQTEVDTSYLMNGAVCGYGSKAPSYRLIDFKKPSKQIMLFECAVSSNAFLWNDASSFPYENDLTDRHGPGANVGFFDFHVEYYPRADYQQQLNVSPGPLWCNPGSATGH